MGKLAISTVGGGLTCITVLSQLGYITVDWDKVQRDYNVLRKRKSNINLSRVPGRELVKVCSYENTKKTIPLDLCQES